MKLGLIITTMFTLIFLASCGAVDDTKFTLKGHIENADSVQNVVLYEGDKQIGTATLDNNKKFNLEGSAPHAGLYTLLIGERPFMLVLENGEAVEFEVDLQEPNKYEVRGSATSANLKELHVVRETFQEQQAALGEEFEKRMNDGEEATIVQRDLMAKSERFIADFSEQVVQFSLETEDNLAGFFGMLILYS